MKKLTNVMIALTLGVSAVNASPVAVDVAQATASSFYGQKSATVVSATTLVQTETNAAGTALYYVFNINQNDGFVIVSADNAASPVIGYSTSGQYVLPAKGTNMEFWMNLRKNELNSIITNNVKATDAINVEWASYSDSKTDRSVHKAMSTGTQLVQSTWDQQEPPYPYNYFMPPTTTGSTSSNQSVTGCVATAMAQIMRYWQYPAKGSGSHSYCDCTSGGYTDNWGTLSASFTHTYNWSAMPLAPTKTSKVSTADTDIARLMYDCGVSVEMDYDPNGSGAYVTTADNPGGACAQVSFVQYFLYDANTIRNVQYPMSSEQAWIDTIENEFNNNRPVEYAGDDPSDGGHTWVCDGNDNTTPYNQLHMNWGWSGTDDGYFLVTSLNPSSLGGGSFSQNLEALIGIQPPGGKPTAVANISQENGVSVYPNPNNGSFTIDMNNVKGSHQLSVFNVLGQNVLNTTLSEGKNEVNFTQIPGMYFYRVLSYDNQMVSEGKLIVK